MVSGCRFRVSGLLIADFGFRIADLKNNKTEANRRNLKRVTFDPQSTILNLTLYSFCLKPQTSNLMPLMFAPMPFAHAPCFIP
jgi:hypothetical protein